MRSFLPIMTQWINHSKSLSNLEHSFIRYGQLFIYLMAIAVIGFLYLGAQRAIAIYLESFQSTEIPNF